MNFTLNCKLGPKQTLPVEVSALMRVSELKELIRAKLPVGSSRSRKIVLVRLHMNGSEEISDYDLSGIIGAVNAFAEEHAVRLSVKDSFSAEVMRPGKTLAEYKFPESPKSNVCDVLVVESSRQFLEGIFSKTVEFEVKSGQDVIRFYKEEIAPLFDKSKTFEEITQVFESDRLEKFTSKPLSLFQSEGDELKKGALPDLKYQSRNLQTDIQMEIERFIESNEFVGLLIGPTGCGKTHQLLHIGKTNFTIFIDAQAYPAANETYDHSLNQLKSMCENVTKKWQSRNADLNAIRALAYAFILTRTLYLKYLREKYPSLTPMQFLLYQIFNGKMLATVFQLLAQFSFDVITFIGGNIPCLKCFICIDEAHVLLDRPGSTIISEMDGNHIQQNGDVNEKSKRGILSALLWAIKQGDYAKKVLFSGTSQRLRNIDNFGYFETKPVSPTLLNNFCAWTPEMAQTYVSSLVDVDSNVLSEILVDNYRPRILENFVYDLFKVAVNDTDSPTIKDARLARKEDLRTIRLILEESYKAVIHRFTRVSIEPIADQIRSNSYTLVLLRLLISSMISCNGEVVPFHLEPSDISFFTDAVGSIYLVSDIQSNGIASYSFYEGYVIDALLESFKHELEKESLHSALNLLRNIIASEGRKSTAKGTPFEAVVLAELLKHKDRLVSDVIGRFGVKFDHPDLRIPARELKMADERIIAERPQHSFIRPTNQFRPDIIAFLSPNTLLSCGIKLYTSNIKEAVHKENLKSTDPRLFFEKKDRATNQEKRRLWVDSFSSSPISLSVRFLFEFPGINPAIDFNNGRYVEDGMESVVILITAENMDVLFSDDVCRVVRFCNV
ncbi:hypothetical protein HK098_007214 [Nowakowskiella sp. JEL0407]|nr:hypothetical protein HK098_007214 [Nowakowskiella sp. JEL0407]